MGAPGDVVLSNALTTGTVESFTGLEDPLEGRQPLIEDPAFLAAANQLLLDAHDWFEDPTTARSSTGLASAGSWSPTIPRRWGRPARWAAAWPARRRPRVPGRLVRPGDRAARGHRTRRPARRSSTTCGRSSTCHVPASPRWAASIGVVLLVLPCAGVDARRRPRPAAGRHRRRPVPPAGLHSRHADQPSSGSPGLLLAIVFVWSRSRGCDGVAPAVASPRSACSSSASGLARSRSFPDLVRPIQDWLGLEGEPLGRLVTVLVVSVAIAYLLLFYALARADRANQRVSRLVRALSAAQVEAARRRRLGRRARLHPGLQRGREPAGRPGRDARGGRRPADPCPRHR